MSHLLYDHLADLFRALAHPSRVQVIDLLSVRPHTVAEMLTEVNQAPSALSQHLAVLRRAGLVRQQRQHGRTFYYLPLPRTKDLVTVGQSTLREAYGQHEAIRTHLRATGPRPRTV